MTDPAVLRVAVVGTGWWGEQHARVFTERQDTELCAIVGRTPERTEHRAAQFGTTPYFAIDQMLDRAQPDLISVCLPNLDHFVPTLELLQAGTPLLVEKPLTFELAEADALLAEAARQGTFFAINFNHRYAKPVRLARAALRDGRVGEPIFATWRFAGEGWSGHHPHANLIETQCHGFDLLEHLCGPITSVSAEMTDAGGDAGPGTVVVALQFANGAVGSLVGSYRSSYAYPGTQHLEINGALGRVIVEDTVKRYTFQSSGNDTREVWEAGYFDDRNRTFVQTFDAHVHALLNSLRSGEQPPVPAHAGRRALSLALAAIESATSGQRVLVADPVVLVP